MEAQPPQDPNRNNNNNYGQPQRAKSLHQGGRNGNNNNNNNNDEPMGIMGDMNESPAVVVMFLVGVFAWFLRERCVC